MAEPKRLGDIEGSKEKAQELDGTKSDATGSYPFSADHKQVFGLMGGSIKDSEMCRAWARMYDNGSDCGPAVASSFDSDDGEREIQYFLYARGERVKDSSVNTNRTCQFFTTQGLLGEESGL